MVSILFNKKKKCMYINNWKPSDRLPPIQNVKSGPTPLIMVENWCKISQPVIARHQHNSMWPTINLLKTPNAPSIYDTIDQPYNALGVHAEIPAKKLSPRQDLVLLWFDKEEIF